MRPYEVSFVAHKSNTTLAPMLDAVKFKPNGRAQWLQHIAWRFLNWRRALEQAYEPKVTVTRHVIDADKFIDRLLKQRRALFEFFHKEGQKIFIGAEDYCELMNEVSIYQHFSFQAEVSKSGRIMGLDVVVIPWMRGVIVMPEV